MLAITFTRKAAGQMRNRILAALEDASQPAPAFLEAHKQRTRAMALQVLERDRQLDWRLLDNPARLQIRTVDSFCDALVRRLPLQAGYGAPGEITEDPKPLYEEAVRRVLLMLGDADRRTADAVATLLTHLDNDAGKLQQLLVGLLEKREQWLRLIDGPHTLTEESLETLRRKSSSPRWLIPSRMSYASSATRLSGNPTTLRAELSHAMRHAAEHAEPLWPISQLKELYDLPGTRPEDAGRWRGIDAFFHGRRQGSPSSPGAQPLARISYQQPRYSRSLPGDVRAVGKPAGVHRVGLSTPGAALLAAAGQLSGGTMAGAAGVVLDSPRAVDALKSVFSVAGQMDFSEVAQAAIAALGPKENPTDLSFGVGGRLRHILVDEFQDTSISQIQLLAALLAPWRPHEGKGVRGR